MSDQNELRDFVKKQTAATRKGATAVLVVGIIIACVIAGYLGFILSWLQKNYQAKDIIDVGYDLAEKEVNARLDNGEPKSYVLQYAPQVMDEAKKQIVENAPKVRQQLEEYAGSLADSLLSQAHDAMSQQVRDVMQTHGQQIREALAAAGDVQKSPTAVRHLQEALESEFEQAAVDHLDRYTPELLRVLNDMDAKMKLFVETPPDKLSQEDQLERELVVILNTLFERVFAPLRGGGLVESEQSG